MRQTESEASPLQDGEAMGGLLEFGTAQPPQTRRNPSTLLNARYQYVPFYEPGRAELLEELDRWCSMEEAVSARLFVGEGGIGKTRLFIEWSKRLRTERWNAGFLPNQGVESAHFAELVRSSAEKPVLMIIDYAESRQHLGELLKAVSRRRDEDGGGRVRVVLLARAAGDWWTELMRVDQSVGALLRDTRPTEVPPLTPRGPQREEVFWQAAKRFAEVLKKEVPAGVPAYLGEARFDRVLYVHMAALAHVQEWACSGEGLMEEVLWHEERFWAQWWESMRKEPVASGEIMRWQNQCRQVVCALTLVGGAAGEQEMMVLQERACGEAEALQRLLLHDVYPGEREGGKERYVGRLEPDLLGEAMVLRSLRKEGLGAGAWLKRVFVGQGEQVIRTGFEVLGRVSAEVDEARRWIASLLAGELRERAIPALEAAKAVGGVTAYSVLGDELLKSLQREGTSEMAVRLDEAVVPTRTISLNGVGSWVLELLLRQLPAGTASAMEERAGLLNDLSVRQSGMGRKQEALVSAHEAVSHFRQLVAARPKESLPDLAGSLMNLGAWQGELGLMEEAIASLQEAVGIYISLGSAENLWTLAGALNNLGVWQGKQGRTQAALAALEDSVFFYRAFAERHASFLPDVALGLINLSNWQAASAQREQAIASLREAVEILYKLTGKYPEGFLPQLALSLNNLSIQLGEAGQRQEALDMQREATRHYKRLADRHPDIFLPDLAMSLNNLGNRLNDAGRKSEALAILQEAVENYRYLAEALPRAFLPDLALSLNNLGVQQGELRMWEEALASFHESVTHYRQLVKSFPQTFLSALATVLHSLGNHQIESGRGKDALASLQEALKIRRELASELPESLLSDMARSLSRIALGRGEVGTQEALAAAEESVNLRRLLVQRSPEKFLPELARSLNTLGSRQSGLGRTTDAITSLEEAVKLLRQLAAQRPETFLPDLAGALNNLGTFHHELGSEEQSLALHQEALDVIWPCFLMQPPALGLNTAKCMKSVTTRLQELGRPIPPELFERAKMLAAKLGLPPPQ